MKEDINEKSMKLCQKTTKDALEGPMREVFEYGFECGMREQRKLYPRKSVNEYWEVFWKRISKQEK